MHPVLLFESFFFHSRDDLERLQPLSQTMLDVIVAGSNVLPLRPIHRVDMDIDYSHGKIRFFVTQPAVDENGDEQMPDHKASIHTGDFAETFLRLQHTCIQEFCVEIRDSPFLRYWKAQADATFRVVSIEFSLEDDTDYGVLDSIMNHLRPRTWQIFVMEYSWHANGDNNEPLKLLDRDSFLHNLQTCRLNVEDDAFPPPAFFLNERGYPNYELQCYHSNIADGIDGFIESFIRDRSANNRLESVFVQWDDREGQQSPAPKQLRKPMEVDMPLPKNVLTAWLIRDVHHVSPCEMHSFVNKQQWKRMEVYKWTVEYDLWGDRRTSHVLQCRVGNL